MKANERFQITGNAAETYERYVVPTLFVPWAQDLMKRAELRAGDRVLDIASGTGVVARHAAERVGDDGKVAGVDLNEGMLEVARAQSSKSGVNVEWRQGDAGSLPFDDATFDVALCQQGLQFFPDKEGALKEMHRVLAPGGRSVVSVVRSLEHNPLMNSQVGALTRHLGAEAAGAIRAICSLGDANELRRLHTAAGLQEIDIQVVSLTITHPDAYEFMFGLMTSTPVADAIAALDESAQKSLMTDVVEGFGSYFDGKGLAFPHVAHVVTART